MPGTLEAGVGTGEAASPRSRATILVPGLGLDARAWLAVREHLEEPSKVVTLPTMGERARRGAGLHVEQQSHRLLAALPDGCDLVLVGHSASCPVVVDVARRTPSVIGLVLVGPVTAPSGRTWPTMLAQWLGTAAHERLWETPILWPQYQATGLGSMARGMEHVRRYRTDVGLRAVHVPVLVIRGQYDRIASAAWCRQLARSRNARTVTVPGAGHMVPLTHPQVVATACGQLHRAVREGSGKDVRLT